MKNILLIAFILICNLLFAQKPNILVIVLDDARYDSFLGGAPFFQSPAINRIANEGVNFKYAFPALSLCSPSRASIMTGLYPHHHHVIDNLKANTDSFNYPTPATILHSKGYYTGFIGKYGYTTIAAKDSFDYKCESSSDFYWNSTYYYNSKKHVVIPGHKTDVLTSKAIEFLDLVPPNKKFLLYLEHKAPHIPYTPRTEDSGIYATADIPFPSNFASLSSNTPSHYIDCYDGIDSQSVRESIIGQYELLAGVEASVDTVLTYLENRGILDSTLIIFTSDNGFMLGEHKLSDKEIALEESIRLPMFIRYPKWFQAGTVITNEMAMNIDIAPTILDAAGVPNTYNMDGISMRSLANHTAHRTELFYEYFTRACKPSSTAVRDFRYKYITNQCTNVSEEFYDILNDPKEDVNLINSPSFSTPIQKYRNKLDSLKTVYGYSLLRDSTLPCELVNVDCTGTCNITATTKVTDVSGNGTCTDGKIKVTPDGNFNSYTHIDLYNDDGLLIKSFDTLPNIKNHTFNCLNAGNYSVKVLDYCCEYDIHDLQVSCPKPTGLTATLVTSNSVLLSWDNIVCNDGYKLQYRKQGESGSWTIIHPTTNNYTATGLDHNTTYEWKVSTNCPYSNPAHINSKYSATQTFNTL